MATARVPGKGSGADDKTSDGAADAENKDVGLVHPLSELSGSEEGALDIDEKNPFRDPIAAQHWREVYDASQYECRHVYDPSLTWTEEEEKNLIRKLDWRVCLWAVCSLQNRSGEGTSNQVWQCIMFFGLQVDRGNLAQAVSDNMLDDLGLDTNGKHPGHPHSVPDALADATQTIITATASFGYPSCWQSFHPSWSPRRLVRTDGFRYRLCCGPSSQPRSVSYRVALAFSAPEVYSVSLRYVDYAADCPTSCRFGLG